MALYSIYAVYMLGGVRSRFAIPSGMVRHRELVRKLRVSLAAILAEAIADVDSRARPCRRSAPSTLTAIGRYASRLLRRLVGGALRDRLHYRRGLAEGMLFACRRRSREGVEGGEKTRGGAGI